MSEGLTFGGIGGVDNSTAEPTTDATPRKIEAFDVDGESNRMTPDASSGVITVVEAGTYDVQGHISFNATLSKTFKVRAYRNTTAIGVPLERKMGTGGDVGSASFCATSVFGVGDTISAWHWSSDGGTSFTARQMSLSAKRVL